LDEHLVLVDGTNKSWSNYGISIWFLFNF